MELREFKALAVLMPKVDRHPNRVTFHGVLTQVDVASDRPPSGAQGHRVMMTRQAAEEALPSLIGMGLDHTPEMDGHDARRKIGVITSAEVIDREVVISGHLFARDFPEVIAKLKAGSGMLGLSYEVADAIIEDVRSPVWKLTKVTFTGAAMLRKDKAAYGRTWIEIGANKVANGMNAAIETMRKGKMEMKHEQAQEIINITERMAAATEALNTAIQRVQAQQESLEVKVQRIVAAVEDGETNLKARIAELEKTNQDLAGKLEVHPATAVGRSVHSGRKTLPPTVSALLAKSGVELPDEMEAAALDAALAHLSVEQRVAVKSQMARAGLIG